MARQKMVRYISEDENDDHSYETMEDEDSSNGESSSHGFMEQFMKEFSKWKNSKRKGKEVERRSRGKVPKSEGHRVLSEGKVLTAHHDSTGKTQPNIVCRVEALCDHVKEFDDTRKELVKMMGFEGLLELDMKTIPRQFCYWLMTRVQEDGTVVFGNADVLSMGAEQVKVVLGIPMGSKVVPEVVSEYEEDTMKVKRVFKLYGVGRNNESVSLNEAGKMLCEKDENGKVVKMTRRIS